MGSAYALATLLIFFDANDTVQQVQLPIISNLLLIHLCTRLNHFTIINQPVGKVEMRRRD
jgi:hypothetical protein